MDRGRDERDHRVTVNLLAGVTCLVLLIAGFWLLHHLVQANRAQICAEAGWRVCPGLTASLR
jgi:hypothetical protein